MAGVPSTLASRAFAAAVSIAAAAPLHADERPWDASIAASWTDYSEFDDDSFGFGLSLSRRLTPWLAADAQLGFSPTDLGRPALSDSRFEGFLGLRAGPRLGAHQVYAAVRPGFVDSADAPEPIVCIAIFPPPLGCALAGGETLFAMQLMGGIELVPGGRGVVRAEVGSLLVKYPGPAIARDGETFDDALWSHNLRVGLSVGLRF
jgi:hypothetical protein